MPRIESPHWQGVWWDPFEQVVHLWDACGEGGWGGPITANDKAAETKGLLETIGLFKGFCIRALTKLVSELAASAAPRPVMARAPVIIVVWWREKLTVPCAPGQLARRSAIGSVRTWPACTKVCDWLFASAGSAACTFSTDRVSTAITPHGIPPSRARPTYSIL
eukprot:1179465-Prorocentrum_minimum.AAC.14